MLCLHGAIVAAIDRRDRTSIRSLRRSIIFKFGEGIHRVTRHVTTEENQKVYVRAPIGRDFPRFVIISQI